MNPIAKAIALVAASLLCLYGFAWLVFTKGVHISETADTTIGVLIVVSALLLPVVGYISVRKHRNGPAYAALFPAFLVSLAPSVILLCALLVVLFVRRPT